MFLSNPLLWNIWVPLWTVKSREINIVKGKKSMETVLDISSFLVFFSIIVKPLIKLQPHTWRERILRSKSSKSRTLQCILISGTHWFQKCNRWKYSPTLQTPSLHRLQGSPCVVILPCKDPVKITGYHSNISNPVIEILKKM